MRYDEREVLVEVMLYQLMGIAVNNLFHTHAEVAERNALSTSPSGVFRRYSFMYIGKLRVAYIRGTNGGAGTAGAATA